MAERSVIENAMEQGNGILRLVPNWVPRSFSIPGRRLKLHPDDYYALGGDRGGIDERWFSSATPADNGSLTAPEEGLSKVVFVDGLTVSQVLFHDMVEELGPALIGARLWDEYGIWPMFAKFFDNKKALPHHIHHPDEHARRIGQLGKPEAYYFPAQMNNHDGDFPYSFFGLEPGTTREQLRQCLLNFETGDNRITDLSRAYRLRVGTGWDIPPGLLHAPGSLCTYEPQRASDVFAMFQSLAGDIVIPVELLVKNTPGDDTDYIEFLLDIVDWELNLDPDFKAHRFMEPLPVRPDEDMTDEGYRENWICYKSVDFSAKELVIYPGRTAVIRDNAAYGLIMLQGHGTMGIWDIESPEMIRYGQLTCDEFFVSEDAAKAGVTISNPSPSDPIVMLKHFGPGNPDLILN